MAWFIALLPGSTAWAQNLPGTPRAKESPAKTKKLELLIKTTTDNPASSGLIAEFEKLNPDIAVHYSDYPSLDLYGSVVNATTTSTRADIVWSSAMDLQVKLANDGYAADYQSSEVDDIPSWANWKDRAYSTTTEPLVMIYNKRLLDASLVPKDRPDLVRLLTDHLSTFQGKIGTYDPELSGVGLLYITQDLRITPRTWNLVAAMGRARVKLYASSDDMIDRVAAGDLLLAYNVVGSYALEHARTNPDLGIILPRDYTLLMSRVALIPRSARNPQAAKRFLDFLLSQQGQVSLTTQLLGAVRDGVQSPLKGYPDAETTLRPIALNIDLLTYLDQAKRRRFLRDWKNALHTQ